MPETTLQAPPQPLTTLTEDEVLFRDNIRQFAEDRVRPLAKEMDEKGIFDKDLIHEFFQLGLMGIEIPEQYGGGGAKFFEAILAVEELSRVDASAGVVVDVQNTLVNNALLRWGNPEQKKRYLPTDSGRSPRAQRQRAGRTGQRLQDRNRNPERRPHRHWRADAWRRPRRLGICREIRRGAQAIRQGDRRVPGNPVPDCTDGNRD